MKRRLRSATALLVIGGVLLALSLLALLVMQLADIETGFDVALGGAAVGVLLAALGAVMYAAGLSHGRSRSFHGLRDTDSQ